MAQLYKKTEFLRSDIFKIDIDLIQRHASVGFSYCFYFKKSLHIIGGSQKRVLTN